MADADPFTDRTEAGRSLAPVVATHLDRLAHHGRPLVLALPRGGVPVGYEVARAVDADLDVIAARKIGVPGQPEVGLGAVTEDGPPILDRTLLHHLGLDERQIQPLIQRERAEVHRRLARYRGDRPHPNLSDRTVVIVDDGLANAPEAVRVRGDTRDRPELVHAASGDDEPVAADLPAPPLGIDPSHLPASQIDPDNLTEDEAHAGRFLSDSLVHEAQPRLVTGPVCGTVAATSTAVRCGSCPRSSCRPGRGIRACRRCPGRTRASL